MLPSFAKNLCLYEVNLRQYSVSGNIRDFMVHLPRLKDLGAGILWMMPPYPVGVKNRKGSLGSYYSVRDYHTIDPFYGTMQDFKDLVRQVHRYDMKILLDWVANHTAWDNPLSLQHPEYYVREENGGFVPPFPEWEDVIKLDYNNKDVWRYMTQAMSYWVEETDIDGFRCDMANLVPAAFWKDAISALKKDKDLFMLAEAEDKDLLLTGFDAIYNWDIFHIFNNFIHEKDNAARLDSIMEGHFSSFPYHSQMLFTSNHDENSWNGTAIERLGSALEATIVLTYTLPGIPLIYSGQEAGNNKRLSFFDKDLIEWKEDKLAVLFRLLNQVRKDNAALWSQGYGGIFKRIPNTLNQHVFSFLRENKGNTIMVMVNLSWEEAHFSLSAFPVAGEYFDIMRQQKVFPATAGEWTLPAWGYLILVK